MQLRDKAINGIRWSAIGGGLTSFIKFIQVCILTRFLLKSEMGVVSIALIFISLCDILSDMGITSAILHKQHISSKQYSSLFIFNIFLSLVFGILLCLIAPIISIFYEQSELTYIIQLFAVNTFVIGFSRLQRTFLQKELKFKILTIVDLSGVIVGLMVLIVLLFCDYGIYSLVYSNIFASFLVSALLITYCRKSLKLYMHFSYKEIVSFIKIGLYQLGASVLDFLSREIDTIIIAKMYPLETVGGYSLCKQLILKLYGTLNPILSKVLTPLLSTLQEDITYLKITYLKIINILSFVNFPLYFFIASLSTPILFYIYGSDYTEFGIILSIIAVTYGLNSVSSPVGNLEVALGRTDLGFYWTIYRILTTCIIMLLLSRTNITTIVVGLLILNVINIIFLCKFLLGTMIKVKISEYISNQYIPLLISLVISIPTYLYNYNGNSITIIIVVGLLYTIGYLFLNRIYNKNFNNIVNIYKSILYKNG